MTKAATATRTNRAYETLTENVERIRSSEQWKAALQVRAKLHNYSFSNVMLIALQCPDATMIAGYRKWQELGRQVRKGEKSIAILAPMVKKMKDDDGEEKRRVIGFRAASVFDVSQTDGEELPMPPAPQLLDGDGEAIDAAYQRVVELAGTLGSKVELVDPETLGTANGAYYLATKAIVIRSDLSPLHRLKTAIHEVAHAMMHNGASDRQLGEVEAESTAYLVSDALGFDTGSYSFAYVAGWAGETDALLKAGDRACKAADQIITAITAHDEVAS